MKSRVEEAVDVIYEDEQLDELLGEKIFRLEEWIVTLDRVLPDYLDADFFLELVDKIRGKLFSSRAYLQKFLEGKMGVVTVTYDLGSLGLDVAKKLADTLGYRVVFSEIMQDVAQRLGVPEWKVENFSEFKYIPSKLSFFDLFQLDKSLIDFGAIFGEKKKEITFEEFREALTKSVTSFAVSNNVVIVGHAAACILKEYPNTLHVKIEAPFVDRVKVYAEKTGVDVSEAERQLRKIDDKEMEFYKDFCDEDISKINLFHLKVNTSRLSVEGAVDVIKKAFDFVVEE